MKLVVAGALALLVACSQRDIELVIDGGAGVEFADADPGAADAGISEGCRPDGPECDNCLDDDGDGLADGFDPHCISSLDDDESSFATGIPGDNRDAVKQDCFFDGDSGGGNDGCDLHVCCLLDLGGGPCPEEFRPNQYDPAACTVGEDCARNCGPLTPPGCDCFGCCTLCNDSGCSDVMTHPAVAPECDVGAIDDPDRCPPCVQQTACSTPCEPTGCVLCPGQRPEDLPPECAGGSCPGDLRPCDETRDCLETEFCAGGCCIRRVD